MDINTMGKVLVSARIENLGDVFAVRRHTLAEAKARTIEVEDALVDTGATLLSMPGRLTEQLGLEQQRTRTARTASGITEFAIYDAVRLTVQGRDCIVEVAKLPDDCPVLIGQLPLEALDFVVDPRGHKLVGNPDHGGKHMIDMF